MVRWLRQRAPFPLRSAAHREPPQGQPSWAAPPHPLILTRTAFPLPLTAGLLGPIVWLLGLLNIAIAAFIEYLEKDEKPPKTAWNAAQTTAITVSLATVFVATVLHMRCAGKRHLAAEGGSHSLLGEEDEEDASFSAN